MELDRTLTRSTISKQSTQSVLKNEKEFVQNQSTSIINPISNANITNNTSTTILTSGTRIN